MKHNNQATAGIYFTFFVLYLHLGAIQGAFTCDPPVDCLAGTIGGSVPDPDDCTFYYICVSNGTHLVPTDTSLPCPAGEYFDGYTGACQPETVVGVCDVDYCKQEVVIACKTSCFNDLELIGFPGDCSKFYQCISGVARVGTCLFPNLYFDGEQCGSDPDGCCDFCKTSCFHVGTKAADPNNCLKYYDCTAIGNVQDVNHSTCPVGEHFDPPSGSCIAGATCTDMCGARKRQNFGYKNE